MGVWGYFPVLLGILIIGTISSNESFAAPVIIDDFQTGSILIDVDQSSDFIFDSVSGLGIIPSPSGIRGVALFHQSGLATVEYHATSGSAFYVEDPNTDGHFVIIWDAGGAGLDADLTDGGANDHFELSISSTTAFSLVLELEDSTNEDFVALPQSALPGLTVVSIPFSSFTGIDFIHINSILLIIDEIDANPATDIEIDFFQTSGQAPVGSTSIPIDSTSMLVAESQTFSWMIPVILSGIGIGLFVVSRKSEN